MARGQICRVENSSHYRLVNVKKHDAARNDSHGDVPQRGQRHINSTAPDSPICPEILAVSTVASSQSSVADASRPALLALPQFPHPAAFKIEKRLNFKSA